MKTRILFLLLLFILPFFKAFTQEETKVKKFRKKYINLSFVNTTLKQDQFPELKSDFGASFTVGRTFYLHKKPIAGILRFGIDATWFDMTYTNYKIEHITYWGTDNYQYHEGEIAMHIGPSITINPVGKMNIHGYFRYAPTFSGLYIDDAFYGNYASFFVYGGAISYSVIGLGIESRSGKCDYKEFFSDKEDEITDKLKTKFNGWRAYLTFKF